MITEENGPVLTKMLQRNQTLRHLDLHNNSLSDIGAFYIGKGLRENIKLKELVLKGCGLTSRGAKDLSLMLAQNCSLKVLDISNSFFLENLDIGRNAIGDQGMAHLAESLKRNRTLKDLHISDCGITDTGLAAAAEVLHNQRRLHITNDFGITHKPSTFTMEYSQTGK